MQVNDQDPTKRPDLPPPSSRQEPDFSLRSLLPWMIPAIVLGIFCFVVMLMRR